eukprot:CAMPEP_0172891910 /NCGR_PEP_ID=MMETSP1075-20121228/144994_1 /TAXON_ID=2916 /ORGANISM="Ceratium fusus, Strain PA161109" /LENGTH=75 /DNA_ID=CAMNT_0013746451 /DNA_START=1 /DNA_END=226 /DNA_ORIENTATION=+
MPSSSSNELSKGGLLPRLQQHFPKFDETHATLLPEKLPRSSDQDAIAQQRKAQSPNDWLESESVAEAARASFAAM